MNILAATDIFKPKTFTHPHRLRTLRELRLRRSENLLMADIWEPSSIERSHAAVLPWLQYDILLHDPDRVYIVTQSGFNRIQPRNLRRN